MFGRDKKAFERVDELIHESVIIVEQTYCHYHKRNNTEYFADEAKSRCLKLIDMSLARKDRRWVKKHKGQGWIERRVEYWCWMTNGRRR